MRRRSATIAVSLFPFLAVLLCAAPASAQFDTAQVSGTIQDNTGGVLPGVTVEASSPAIIEKTRNVVTDDQGRYRIDALRPGTYRLAFTLPGFSTVVRDAIDVPSEVVVTVNADMKVGALEETITVTADAPLIETSSRADALHLRWSRPAPASCSGDSTLARLACSSSQGRGRTVARTLHESPNRCTRPRSHGPTGSSPLNSPASIRTGARATAPTRIQRSRICAR